MGSKKTPFLVEWKNSGISTPRNGADRMEATETKLHSWLTKVWNDKMADANEPMWILTDELVKLFGVEIVRNALSKSNRN